MSPLANRQRTLSALGIAAAAVLIVHCGARSHLDEGGAGEQQTQTTTTSSSSGTGTGGGGMGGGGGGGGLPPPLCAYEPTGDPVEALGLDNADVGSPSLAIFATGGDNAPARLGMQVFALNAPGHPKIRIAKLRVDEPWPSGVTVLEPPTTIGADSHTWAELALAPNGKQLALAWWDDPGMVGRLAFRTIDIASWAPGPQVTVDPDGSAALALAPGGGVDPSGGYGGDGYAIVWRSSDPAQPTSTKPMVAVLDQQGNVALGPHQAASFAPEQRSPSAVWTGSTYLLATAFVDCVAGDPLCAPDALAIARVRPASGDENDDSGVELASSVPNESFSGRAYRPVVAAYQGRVWAVWPEAPSPDPNALRFMRSVELDASGNTVGLPLTVATDARPLNRPGLIASDQGLALAWLEHGGDDGPPDQLGAGELVVITMDHSRAILSTHRLPITMPQGGIPSLGVIDEPRSLLVNWAGLELHGGGLAPDVAYLARLDCIPQP